MPLLVVLFLLILTPLMLLPVSVVLSLLVLPLLSLLVMPLLGLSGLTTVLLSALSGTIVVHSDHETGRSAAGGGTRRAGRERPDGRGSTAIIVIRFLFRRLSRDVGAFRPSRSIGRSYPDKCTFDAPVPAALGRAED